LRAVKIKLGKRSYDVVIGHDLFTAAASFLQKGDYSKKALLVTDSTVNRLYADKLADALREAGFALAKIVVPSGEEAKSLAWAEKIYDTAIEGKLDRQSPFIALGGGVPGDLTGFAAATYMRGVPFIQIPTTLLAQVDASVGGKVAVNHPAGKNMIGAFHQPDAVFADLASLQSLSPRDYASGLAEIVKTACLEGGGRLDFLAEQAGRIEERDEEVLSSLVAGACAYKAKIVEDDERETGVRMFLNLGHTYGHAIETEGGFSLYTHGEAVSIGLRGALLLSGEFASLAPQVTTKVSALLEKFHLPLKASGIDPERAYQALWHDKKAVDEKLRWVLLKKPGDALISKDIPLLKVREVLAGLVENGKH
jgi:3-dehydroquinate synthase